MWTRARSERLPGGGKIIVTPLKKRNDQKDDTGMKIGSEERTHPHPPIRGLEVL